MNLTKDAIRNIINIGFSAQNQKSEQTIEGECIVQIIENYFPQAQQDKIDKLICYKISDGHSKMKALFMKIQYPQLVELRKEESLQQFPILRILAFKIIGKPVKGEDFPILVTQLKFLQTLDKIIGMPMSYKAYVQNAFNNPHGAVALDELDELEFLISDSKNPQECKEVTVIKQAEMTSKQHNLNQQLNVQQQFNQTKKQVKEDYYPLAMLTPNFTEQFRGRIVRLSDVKAFGGKNGKKEGKLFSLQIMDEESLINATFFGENAEKFSQVLVLGKVYSFKGFQVKAPRNLELNKSQGSLPFDFIFDLNTQITELDDDLSIPQNKFNFLKLDQIIKQPLNSQVDCIAIVKTSTKLFDYQGKFKDGKQFRRTLRVYDDTQQEIEVSLYGQLAQQFDYQPGQIYLFKLLKVNEYNNAKTLSSTYQSNVHFDMNMKECNNLLQWFKTFDGELFEQYTNLKTISQLIEESQKCEMDESLKIFSEVRAHLIMIKSSGTLFYQSCITCCKKAQQVGEEYHCQACQQTFPSPKYRFILNCKIADQTNNIWVTAGNEQAEALVNISALEVKELIDQGKDKEKIEALNIKAYKEFRFRLFSKLEIYNDLKRVKHQIQKVIPIAQQDTQQILRQIDFYIKNI